MKTTFLTVCLCLIFSWTLNAATAPVSVAGDVDSVATNPLQADMMARHHHRKAHPAQRHHGHPAGRR